MKIAFVSANRESLPDAVIPLGLLYVMGSCPPHHDRMLWDLCFEDDPVQALRQRLLETSPDVVAFGLRNIQNNDYSGIATNVAYYRSLIETVRSASDAVIILGGAGFSVMPAELVRTLRPDFGIQGEGEASFPHLIAALERGEREPRDIPGLLTLRGERLISTPPDGTFLDLDTLAVPDRSQLDPRYAQRFGIDSVQTRRGCSMGCVYCTYPLIEGRRLRLRDPERIADEVLSLPRVSPGMRHFFIVDAQFNLPPAHAKAVCRALIARGNTLPWTCYANPIGFDAELASLLVEAGCVGMEIGADSGCDEVLKLLGRGFDTRAIRRIHALSRGAGLKDCHTFMLGTPHETLDDVLRSLDFIADLDPFAAILMLWTDDAEALDSDYAGRRRALREQICALLPEHPARSPRWVIPSLGVQFNPRLFAALRRHGRSGPLWQHIHLRTG